MCQFYKLGRKNLKTDICPILQELKQIYTSMGKFWQTLSQIPKYLGLISSLVPCTMIKG